MPDLPDTVNFYIKELEFFYRVASEKVKFSRVYRGPLFFLWQQTIETKKVDFPF